MTALRTPLASFGRFPAFRHHAGSAVGRGRREHLLAAPVRRDRLCLGRYVISGIGASNRSRLGFLSKAMAIVGVASASRLSAAAERSDAASVNSRSSVPPDGQSSRRHSRDGIRLDAETQRHSFTESAPRKGNTSWNLPLAASSGGAWLSRTATSSRPLSRNTRLTDWLTS